MTNHQPFVSSTLAYSTADVEDFNIYSLNFLKVFDVVSLLRAHSCYLLKMKRGQDARDAYTQNAW